MESSWRIFWTTKKFAVCIIATGAQNDYPLSEYLDSFNKQFWICD